MTDGKGEQGRYQVWRVIGPAGPEEEFFTDDRKEAWEAVRGCWDYEVTDTVTGKQARFLRESKRKNRAGG